MGAERSLGKMIHLQISPSLDFGGGFQLNLDHSCFAHQKDHAIRPRYCTARGAEEEEESEKREEHYCLAFARSLKSLPPSPSGDSNSIIKELRPLPLKAFLLRPLQKENKKAPHRTLFEGMG